MADSPDTRTPAQIEADIKLRAQRARLQDRSSSAAAVAAQAAKEIAAQQQANAHASTQLISARQTLADKQQAKTLRLRTPRARRNALCPPPPRPDPLE